MITKRQRADYNSKRGMYGHHGRVMAGVRGLNDLPFGSLGEGRRGRHHTFNYAQQCVQRQTRCSTLHGDHPHAAAITLVAQRGVLSSAPSSRSIPAMSHRSRSAKVTREPPAVPRTMNRDGEPGFSQWTVGRPRFQELAGSPAGLVSLLSCQVPRHGSEDHVQYVPERLITLAFPHVRVFSPEVCKTVG
jgi:hypothetical protein